MPTNVYFDTGTRPEQHLYEDLIIEQLRIYGQDVHYIPRNLVSEDTYLAKTVFLNLKMHILLRCMLIM